MTMNKCKKFGFLHLYLIIACLFPLSLDDAVSLIETQLTSL